MLQLSALVEGSVSETSSQFIASLGNFESTLASNLSEAGRTSLKAGSTAMRYSEVYWENVQASGSSHPWYEIDLDRRYGQTGKPKWWKRDLAGAAATGVTASTWSRGGWFGLLRIVVMGAIASAKKEKTN